MAICIEKISARQIIDSRAVPTIEVEVMLNNGTKASACAPSGASKGKNEALELRDLNPDYLFSKSVLKAVNNVNDTISKALCGLCPFNQYEIDSLLEELDGTNNFSNLGANASLATSMAVARCASKVLGLELFEYTGGISARILPVPMINILNGGAHASNKLDFQEFMIVPSGAETFSDAIRISLEIFHKLKEILQNKGFLTSVGDEGGFAPEINNPTTALELILDAIFEAGYTTDIVKLALDVAASEFYKDGKYNLCGINKVLTTDEMIEYILYLSSEYPIISFEDALSEDDWDGWRILSEKIGKKTMLVGDDLFVTNSDILKRGIENNIANSVLIKPNQIGTVSKTLECIDLAKRSAYKTIVSHRSGETEDVFIADLAVGVNSPFIKTGSLSRSERCAKYNRLLKIEQILGNGAIYSAKLSR